MKKIVLFSCFLFLAATINAQMPVLMYHANPSFGFNETMFAEHMDFLDQNDYHTVTLDQFYDWYKNEEALPVRPIVVTFDDNYIGVYDIAYSVMQARNQVGINFTHTNYVGVGGTNDHCDWTEIQIMEDAGVFLTESHTRNHPYLTGLSESAAWDEINGSKSDIETNMTSKICNYIAYPFGDTNADVIAQCETAGYLCAFLAGGGPVYHDDPPYELSRLGVDGADLSTFKSKIGYNDLPPEPPGEGWTIDNKGVNFFYESADWFSSTSSTGYYGDDYLACAAGNGTKTVRWGVYLPSGQYEIHVWWTSHNNRATNAKYNIDSNGGTTEVTVNQQENGSQWNSLGVFDFSSDSPASVTLSDDADGYVIADGIWFEPVNSGISSWLLY